SIARFNRLSPGVMTVAQAPLVPAELLLDAGGAAPEGCIAVGRPAVRGGRQAGRQLDSRIAAEIMRVAREVDGGGHGPVEVFARAGFEMPADMLGQRRADLDLLAMDLDMHGTSRAVEPRIMVC